ncbi:MAG: cobalt-precorrin-5B (C(1))-methyltransferase, partial [Oleispira sp.]|nr:cobalt-precorrin-5B (C(1))-methyltransferase [Oleispira sp.]
MWPESADNTSKEEPKSLRSGLTTGCCATACSIAAAHAVLGRKKNSVVSVTLPKGKVVELTISSYKLDNGLVKTSTIKDAGDDPDVTHGAEVFVELKLIINKEIVLKAAKGVGIVTREGLAVAVGEPAINPVPRKMIREHLQNIAQQYHYAGGFEVAVGVIKGEQLALKTMNPRLGIIGGLSILGTTGIVRPFSCAAYIASIHQGIDVATTNGYRHIAASTGSSSEAVIRNHYQLPEIALIEMGDFVGAVFKHLRNNCDRIILDKLSLCGGFGKMTKLAQGHLDLHSKASSIDLDFLAVQVIALGGSDELVAQVKSANTSIEVLKLCQSNNIDLASEICQ